MPKIKLTPEKGQMSIYNFFTPGDKKNDALCPYCGVQYSISKINWHKEFDCKMNFRRDKKIVKTSLPKSKIRKKRLKAKRSKKSISCSFTSPAKGDSDFDVVILDSDSEGKLTSPCLKSISQSTLNEKDDLIAKLRLEWDSPISSPIKGQENNADDYKTNINLENISDDNSQKLHDISNFSLISEEDSGDEFENMSPNKRNFCKSFPKNVSSYDREKRILRKRYFESNITPKKEVKCDLSSDYSCDSFMPHTPGLVSPNRTPTPSPESKHCGNKAIRISPCSKSSPGRFNFRQRGIDILKNFDTLENSTYSKRWEKLSEISPNKIALKNVNKINSENYARNLLPNFEESETQREVAKTFQTENRSNYRHIRGMYLDNFLTILHTVMKQPDDKNLFNKQDLDIIDDFSKLSMPAQKLYVRLFQRKRKWNKVSCIDYQDICEKDDMFLYINELIYAGFLSSESDLVDLSEILSVLDLNEIKKLCKDMKLMTLGNKCELITKLIKFDKQQKPISSLFSKKSSKNSSVLLNQAKTALGKACILIKDVADVFMRVLLIYSPGFVDEDEENGQQALLISLLRVSMGDIKYPSYVVNRKKSIFKSRENVLRFQMVLQIEADIHEKIKLQEWEEIINIYKNSTKIIEDIESSAKEEKYDLELPTFLRRFTTMSLVIRIKYLVIEAYQRLKQHESAVDLLEELLEQKIYSQDSRGRWYDRLALNLHQHLKNPRRALEVIKEGMDDCEVRVGHRLSLSQRAERIFTAKNQPKFLNKFKDQILLMSFTEAPCVWILGKSLPDDNTRGGYKKMFITDDNDMVCSVEELAIEHYKEQGFTIGVHSEGRIVGSLFGIFLWDAIYLPVPDAFRSHQQRAPLDLDSLHFYESRRKIIDKRLKQMSKWTLTEANDTVRRIWTEYKDSACLVDWSIFSSLDFVQGLVSCLGLKLIISMCRRLAEDHRFTRSGFPDLIVWNPQKKVSKIVEVKTENDHLSTKQKLWIDFLLNNGADVEVCHVKNVGAKRSLMPTRSTRESKRLATIS